MNQERFYKLGEVRAMLNVSRATLWRWTAENGLKVVRVGSVARIRESDLQAFLARHETGEASAEPSQPCGGTVQEP
jgi:excisionase family DNA binding protein